MTEISFATMASSMVWAGATTFSIVIFICVGAFGRLAIQKPQVPSMLAVIISIVVAAFIGTAGLVFTPFYALTGIVLSIIVGIEIGLLRKAGYFDF